MGALIMNRESWVTSEGTQKQNAGTHASNEKPKVRLEKGISRMDSKGWGTWKRKEQLLGGRRHRGGRGGRNGVYDLMQKKS